MTDPQHCPYQAGERRTTERRLTHDFFCSFSTQILLPHMHKVRRTVLRHKGCCVSPDRMCDTKRRRLDVLLPSDPLSR